MPGGRGRRRALGLPVAGAHALDAGAIGRRDPHEVCTYPDSGKVMVRSLQRIGRFEGTDDLADEPRTLRLLERWRDLGG